LSFGLIALRNRRDSQESRLEASRETPIESAPSQPKVKARVATTTIERVEELVLPEVDEIDADDPLLGFLYEQEEQEKQQQDVEQIENVQRQQEGDQSQQTSTIVEHEELDLGLDW
jgi:hypothetical protein